jgi:hypothetical protein
VWSAATLAGVKFVRGPEHADAIFYFEDVTVGTPSRIAGRPVLNAGVTDISKSRVAEAFGRVAGYDLKLDPARHTGRAVEKSELNGKHDGRLVDCPTAPLPGKSYQRFIDSSDGETAYDYRTTIINRKPQFVLVKTKPARDRFSIHNATVTFHELDQVFSAEEIELIRRFAEDMQLDWGAFDVLRDRASARIYVVDVNKTDTGPAVDLSLRPGQAQTRHRRRFPGDDRGTGRHALSQTSRQARQLAQQLRSPAPRQGECATTGPARCLRPGRSRHGSDGR